MKVEKLLKGEKVRDMSTEELKGKERELGEQIFRLKFQLASGQTDTLAGIRVMRKNLAKVKTVLRARELESARKA
jgi:large subunit ribosomal protein L29